MTNKTREQLAEEFFSSKQTDTISLLDVFNAGYDSRKEEVIQLTFDMLAEHDEAVRQFSIADELRDKLDAAILTLKQIAGPLDNVNAVDTSQGWVRIHWAQICKFQDMARNALSDIGVKK